jgi:transposase
MIDLNDENMLDEEILLLISRMEKELESKDNEINELKNKLAYLENQILNKNKMIFGKSSEQVDSNQLSLFDEAEKIVILKLQNLKSKK